MLVLNLIPLVSKLVKELALTLDPTPPPDRYLTVIVVLLGATP